MKKFVRFLENTNKWIIRLVVISIVTFIWLGIQFISQPSKDDVVSSYRCSTYYSKLYDQNRISMSFGASPMQNSELREQYFDSLIDEVQIAQSAADLNCGELASKINFPTYIQTRIGNENFTGDELLVYQKTCRLGYEYLFYESFLNNDEYIRDEIDEELDCSAGQRIIDSLSE
jgi:hypothetical protein